MRKRKRGLLGCRGLRSDIRQNTYGKICDADPVGARDALVSAAGPKAMTALEHIDKLRRKPCKIFRGDGDVCTRYTCLNPRAKHPQVWRQVKVAS